MKYFLSLSGIILSFFMIRYREKFGDAMGEADWMRKIGGIYVVVVIIAILIFFWSVATLTNTSEIFFAPILWLLPGLHGNTPTDF